MTISFPFSATAFFGRLKFTEFQISVPPMMETNETEGGEIISVEHGPQLWSGSATCIIQPYADGAKTVALFETLLRSDASFHAYDSLRQWPQRDAKGLAIANKSPKVSPVAGNARGLRLSGFPVGYKMTAGDLLSFNYGSNPTRIGLHRVVSTEYADSSGDITSLEVHPPVRPGLANNTALRLAPATCKAKLTSYDPPTSTLSRRAEISFSWRQTLR
jgi:hypothetical protein